MRPPARAHLALGLLLLCLACGPRSSGQRSHITVFAASSLTESFSDMKSAFEAANPGVEVTLSYAGSQVLRAQIQQGAPADVFASANHKHIDALRERGQVSDSAVFARNMLVLVTPKKNPSKLGSFADLPKAIRLVLATPEVPVGNYARRAMEKAAEEYGPEFLRQSQDHIVSLESNTRLVLAKVTLGEADAAIVYRTDARQMDGIITLAIPKAFNIKGRYYQAQVKGTKVPELAKAWQAFVLSPQGQQILAAHGFLPPFED